MNQRNKTHFFNTLILTLFSTCSLNGYLCTLSCWKDTETKNPVKLVILGDLHEGLPSKAKKTAQQSAEQLDFLLRHLKANGNSIVIVEDLDGELMELKGQRELFCKKPLQFNPNRKTGFSLDYLHDKLDHTQTPLAGLTQFCHASDIPVENVEFRYFTLPFLYNRLTGKDFYNLHMNIVKEIESYNDDARFNAVYKRKLKKFKEKIFKPWQKSFSKIAHSTRLINECLYAIDFDKDIDKSIEYFLYLDNKLGETKKRARKYATQDLKELEDEEKLSFITCDLFNPLLDLRILHNIYTHKNCNQIFVLAGTNHVHAIEKMLPKLGFLQTSKHGSVSSSPLNLSRIFEKTEKNSPLQKRRLLS